MATTTDFVDQKKTNKQLFTTSQEFEKWPKYSRLCTTIFFFVKSISRKLKQYIYIQTQTNSGPIWNPNCKYWMNEIAVLSSDFLFDCYESRIEIFVGMKLK